MQENGGELHNVLCEWEQIEQWGSVRGLPPVPIGSFVRVTDKSDANWWAATSGFGVTPGWVPSNNLQPQPPDLEDCADYLEFFQSADASELTKAKMVSFCKVHSPISHAVRLRPLQ